MEDEIYCEECDCVTEHDHGICFDCGTDNYDVLIMGAEYVCEGDR